MKKIIFALLIIPVFLFININTLCACKMAPPYIQISAGEEECDIYKNYAESSPEYSINVQSAKNNNVDEACANLKLSDNDKTILLGFIKKYETDLKFPNYIHITNQSENEYSNFLAETKKINFKICSCGKIIPEGRSGNWTVYTSTYKDSCSFSAACFQPPAFCPNSIYFIPILIYTGIGIFLMIGIIVVIKVIRKRKRGLNIK